MKRLFKTIILMAIVSLLCATAGASPDPDPETFSIDAASPSVPGLPVDQADLLNPGMSVQIPKANLTLGAGDELDALSTGIDAVQENNIVYFSVDRLAIGIPGPLTPLDVNGQALLNQHAGDIFVTTNQAGTGSVPIGINSLHINQNFQGEIPVVGPLVNNVGGPLDNLDALSHEEFDLAPAIPDQLQDRIVYFSLAAGSPTLGGGFSSADILTSPAGGGPLGVFALAGQMGLLVQDDLDALALLDLNGDGIANPGMDLALFSLAPGSPTLLGAGASPADLFLTSFTGLSNLRYPAISLGLLPEDNVDALEVQIPEPATLALLLLGGLVMLRRR